MILPMKYSVMSAGLFMSYGLGTKYHAKNVYVYTCCGTGYFSPSSIASQIRTALTPDNRDIALASIISSGDRLTTKTAAPQQLQGFLVEFMCAGYPTVVHGAPQMVSSLRAAVELGKHNELSGVNPNDGSSDSDSSDD